MKKTFFTLIILALAAFLVSFTIYSQQQQGITSTVASAAHSALHPYGTCTGSKYCSACKNCKYCKHCAKNGGSCGVCK